MTYAVTGTASLTSGPGHDPLDTKVELPFEAVYYPMGFPVSVSSNCSGPLEAAEVVWRRYPAAWSGPPVRVKVIVGPRRSKTIRNPGLPRGQEHLITISHGRDEFAVADLTSGFAFATLSQNTIEDQTYFRYYFLEPLVYLMLAARHFVFVHASAVARNGRALVLCGESGAGKTCLAYACARRGWDFVTGDALHIVRKCRDRTVIGRPFEIRFRKSARRVFPELRKFRAAKRPGGKVDLEVDTAQLGIPVALSAAARGIVFLERSEQNGLTRCTKEYAIEKLEETICFGDEQIRRQQLDTLIDFLELPVWRLRYSDVDQAEHKLSALFCGERPC